MEDTKAIHLLNKGKQGIVKMIFSRTGLMVLLILIQAGVVGYIFMAFRHLMPYIWGGSVLFSSSLVLYILNSGIDPTAKITWLLTIMLLPVFGGLLFLYIKSDVGHIALAGRLNYILGQSGKTIQTEEAVLKRVQEEKPELAALEHYIGKSGAFPVYDKAKVSYFPLGEEKWKAMLEQLEQAKHFIFMEYFIVDEGEMWGRVLEILARKAKEGVEVRVMYDGTCEFSLLPKSYPKQLRKLGIQCKVFSPVTPFLSTHYNYRDHRKILVIDGKVAFNGGVNLADEYINQIERFGHWKDTAVMVQGKAVQSYTLMFLQMWGINEAVLDFEPYLQMETDTFDEPGYVLPYADSPLDQDKVGERVYMDILNRAKKYVYIMSPYLILDGELETALCFAAERGVDVRLILPGIPDKKMPYALAKTHYKSLLHAGVKLYEYTPGFVHAKVFLADDKEGVVGTINLDYRSLYHHFECATYMYEVPCLKEIKKDYENTQMQCRKVTMMDVKREKRSVKIMGALAKIIAPLM